MLSYISTSGCFTGQALGTATTKYVLEGSSIIVWYGVPTVRRSSIASLVTTVLVVCGTRVHKATTAASGEKPGHCVKASAKEDFIAYAGALMQPPSRAAGLSARYLALSNLKDIIRYNIV